MTSVSFQVGTSGMNNQKVKREVVVILDESKLGGSSVESNQELQLDVASDLTFNCRKLIINPNEVLTQWPEGFPVDFTQTKRLIFDDGKKKVVYTRL